jgi:hypothetical protein
VEVLVHFRDGSRESLLNQVRWIQAIDDSLEENQTVGGVFSVATFIPNWPKGSNVRAAVVRSVLKNRIDSGLEEFASKGLVHMDSEGRTWRLMAKVSAVSKSSYGEMTESIRKTVMDTMLSEPDGTNQKARQCGVYWTITRHERYANCTSSRFGTELPFCILVDHSRHDVDG